MPQTGPRTSRTCLWTFVFQEIQRTLSSVAGESAAIADMVTVTVTVTVTATRPMEPQEKNKSKTRVRPNLDLTLLPIHLLNQNPDQNQKRTLRPHRPTGFQQRRLLQTLSSRSLWTTWRRTLPSLTSPRTLRVAKYNQNLCKNQNNPTLVRQRGDAIGGRLIEKALKPTTPTITKGNPMETQHLSQIFQKSLWTEGTNTS